MLDLGLIAPNVVRADGQGRAMLELARAAAADGARVTVYTDRLDDELRDAVRWVRVRGAGLSQFLYDTAFWRRASLASRRARHDVMCVMGPCARPVHPYVYYAEFAWLGWRDAWTPADAPGAYHRAHARFAARLERRVVAGARAAIAVGDTVAADLRRAGATAPITIVPNGIDIDEFAVVSQAERAAARARFDVPPGAAAVGFVGEYNTTRKGLGPLLEAVGRGDEHVLVAGDGPAARYPDLAGRARFLGKVVPVRPVFAASDVVVVASTYEPFSLVALEAAAAQVPLVLSARAGAVEHLRDGAVVLNEPSDPRAIRAALDEVRADPEVTAARARGARAAAEALEWRRTAREALAVLERTAHLQTERAR